MLSIGPRATRLLPLAFCLWSLAWSGAADLVPVEPLGLRVQRGFRVTQWADSDLANDIYAMTLDARGNVVVTSRGYIRTLQDTNGDGVADTAEDFATPATGGMGLCFEGNDLYCTADGALLRYTDADDDGVADGAAERLLALQFAEHGGHAMRKGPDGWWYVIAGNETKFSADHTSRPGGAITKVEGGALLRLPPDFSSCEAIAHGFRNPYDFDFNWAGDLFTYDSDVESDFFLPWYTPTRLYHVGYALHHGWRLDGWRRSWARPDYYTDTVPLLANLGRGSPTGVLCYRHYQFPQYYRGGFFALDWTFGRVLFTPLTPDGASYRAAPEVFLEPLGTHGFAPTDIEVTPDGSLLVCIGGRKTRGAIYRIESIAAGVPSYYASNWMYFSASEAETVLNAPQPLAAWSRAYWVPIAQQLGPEPFARAAATPALAPSLRVRAVEVLTEIHGGLAPDVAATLARTDNPFVRARVAWSLGRVPTENAAPVLLALAQDAAPPARRAALETLADHAHQFAPATLQQALAPNLGHADKRLRLAAARLAALLPEAAWNALWARRASTDAQSRLTLTLALLWRSPADAINAAAVEAALSVLAQTRSADLRLQAVRLAMLALGDYHLHNPSVEVYTAYEPALSLQSHGALAARIRQAVGALFPSGDATLDFEAARLLAMVEDDSPGTPAQVVAFLADKSTATSDFHYLTVLSRLRAPTPPTAVPKVAHALLALDRKLAGQEQRIKQNWSLRLAEVAQTLVAREPALGDALLRHPEFATPGHVTLAACLEGERYLAAARLYFAAVQKNARFAWSAPLVGLLGALPAEQVRPLLRQQWNNVVLRDELLLRLADKPDAADRDRFLAGLASLNPQVVRACLEALSQLPGGSNDAATAPVLRLLRRLCNEPQEQAARAQALALLNRGTGRSFTVQETGGDADQLKRAYQPVFDWAALRFPALVRALDGDGSEDPKVWELRLKNVQWGRGHPARGAAIFQERGCLVCHAGATPLGPDLAGVTGRFSPLDLFHAIVFPSRDVAAPYRTTVFQTRDGQTYAGLVVFESADGVIVQTGATTTVRLADSDLVSRQPSAQSLMPAGLLAGLDTQALADLYAYLKTLLK